MVFKIEIVHRRWRWWFISTLWQ